MGASILYCACHSMVNDALSATVPIVAVNQVPISILVVGKGGYYQVVCQPCQK